MTPTPEQARAELERRKENRGRKQRGEPTVKADPSELTKASKEALKEWAK